MNGNRIITESEKHIDKNNNKKELYLKVKRSMNNDINVENGVAIYDILQIKINTVFLSKALIFLYEIH